MAVVLKRLDRVLGIPDFDNVAHGEKPRRHHGEIRRPVILEEERKITGRPRLEERLRPGAGDRIEHRQRRAGQRQSDLLLITDKRHPLPHGAEIRAGIRQKVGPDFGLFPERIVVDLRLIHHKRQGHIKRLRLDHLGEPDRRGDLDPRDGVVEHPGLLDKPARLDGHLHPTAVAVEIREPFPFGHLGGGSFEVGLLEPLPHQLIADRLGVERFFPNDRPGAPRTVRLEQRPPGYFISDIDQSAGIVKDQLKPARFGQRRLLFLVGGAQAETAALTGSELRHKESIDRVVVVPAPDRAGRIGLFGNHIEREDLAGLQIDRPIGVEPKSLFRDLGPAAARFLPRIEHLDRIGRRDSSVIPAAGQKVPLNIAGQLRGLIERNHLFMQAAPGPFAVRKRDTVERPPGMFLGLDHLVVKPVGLLRHEGGLLGEGLSEPVDILAPALSFLKKGDLHRGRGDTAAPPVSPLPGKGRNRVVFLRGHRRIIGERRAQVPLGGRENQFRRQSRVVPAADELTQLPARMVVVHRPVVRHRDEHLPPIADAVELVAAILENRPQPGEFLVRGPEDIILFRPVVPDLVPGGDRAAAPLRLVEVIVCRAVVKPVIDHQRPLAGPVPAEETQPIDRRAASVDRHKQRANPPVIEGIDHPPAEPVDIALKRRLRLILLVNGGEPVKLPLPLVPAGQTGDIARHRGDVDLTGLDKPIEIGQFLLCRGLEKPLQRPEGLDRPVKTRVGRVIGGLPAVVDRQANIFLMDPPRRGGKIGIAEIGMGQIHDMNLFRQDHILPGRRLFRTV